MTPVFQWVYASQSSPPAGRGDRLPAVDRSGASASDISGRIEQAFDAASSSTGTSFEYLVKTAQRESAMNPAAKAKTSSAAGLFQFIESTWLETMKQSGPALGLGAIADQIEVDARGRHTVANPQARADILALRHDPEIASMMAGALTSRNADFLSRRIGREPTGGELYVAHFLGANGAASLIEMAGSNPNANAVEAFPRQAAANRPIFYEGGQPRTVAAVYANLVSRHGDMPRAVEPAYDPAMLTAFADGSALDFPAPADASSADRVRAGWQAAEPQGAFSGLFRTDTAAGAFSAAAWTGYAAMPGLFEMAAAEDATSIALDEERRQQAAVAVRPAGPSLLGTARSPLGPGPLDLSKFLDTGRG